MMARQSLAAWWDRVRVDFNSDSCQIESDLKMMDPSQNSDPIEQPHLRLFGRRLAGLALRRVHAVRVADERACKSPHFKLRPFEGGAKKAKRNAYYI